MSELQQDLKITKALAPTQTKDESTIMKVTAMVTMTATTKATAVAPTT